MPKGYYALMVPSLLRMDLRLMPVSRRAELDRLGMAARGAPEYAGVVHDLFERLLPSSEEGGAKPSGSLTQLLHEHGFDSVEHDQIKAGLKNGTLGLAQNRLPVTSKIEDVYDGDVFDARIETGGDFGKLGREALRGGTVAVVSLAGGAGSRWTKGAGVVKGLNPFAKLGGKYRNFIEVHLAKSRRTSRENGASIPHVITTSYLTHAPIARHTEREANYGYEGDSVSYRQAGALDCG